MKLLYLDSDHVSKRVFEDVFESWGVRVLSCSHGSELLRLLSAKPDIDLVITETELPGSAPGTLIPLLRLNFPDQPIIVLTACPSVSSAVAALKAGADDYLPKPFDLNVLRKRLFAALQKKIRNGPAAGEIGLESAVQEIKDMAELLLQRHKGSFVRERIEKVSLDHLDQGVLALDNEGRVLLINQKMRRLLDITEEDILGIHLFVFMPTLRESDLFRAWQQAVVEQSRSEELSFRVSLGAQTERDPVEGKVIPVRLEKENQSILGVVFLTKPLEWACLEHEERTSEVG